MKYLLLSLVCLNLFADPVQYTIKDLGARNLFSMSLDASLENNIAVSRFITGILSFDPAKKNELSGSWDIDLRTLDTSNEIRNLELREQILKIPDNPILRIELPPTSLSGKIADDKPLSVNLNLNHRYATKTIPIKSLVKLTFYKASPKTSQRLPGNLLRLQITTDWNLDSFGLNISENSKMIFPKNFTTQTDIVGSDYLPIDKPIFPEAPKPR